LLSDQFGWLGLAIGIYGLLFSHARGLKKMVPGMTWLFIVFSIFSIGYNSYDSEVYLIPAFLVAAIWVGVGALELVEWTRHRAGWLGVITANVILIGLIVPAAFHYREVDASHDDRAENFGREVFRSAPAQAIIFTQGDEATFALRYFQYVLHQRADVALVVADLMPYDWYRTGLAFTYPTLHVPEQAVQDWSGTIIQANPGRPVCEVSYLTTAEISCH
jgi:vacuolar-type H+-ATPase subunit I/STV1